MICRSDDDDCNSFANDHPLMVVMMMGEGGKQVLYSLKRRRLMLKTLKLRQLDVRSMASF